MVCHSKVTKVAVAISLGLIIAGCQAKKEAAQPPVKRNNSAAIAVLQIINSNAQTCWIKSKDRAFRTYRVIPELDTTVGVPRILIVKAKSAQGLPQMVIEAEGTPARLSSYGPLASDDIGARINSDVTRWQKGGKGCTA